jgi:hypothetical protein
VDAFVISALTDINGRLHPRVKMKSELRFSHRWLSRVLSSVYHLSPWLLAWLYSSTLKMESTCSFETSVDFQQTTWRYIADDRTLREEGGWEGVEAGCMSVAQKISLSLPWMDARYPSLITVLTELHRLSYKADKKKVKLSLLKGGGGP